MRAFFGTLEVCSIALLVLSVVALNPLAIVMSASFWGIAYLLKNQA